MSDIKEVLARIEKTEKKKSYTFYLNVSNIERLKNIFKTKVEDFDDKALSKVVNAIIEVFISENDKENGNKKKA